MGGGGGYNSRRNRKAVLAVFPEKRGVVDDWNDLLAEEKKVKFERETGTCARCKQRIPGAPRETATFVRAGERRLTL